MNLLFDLLTQLEAFLLTFGIEEVEIPLFLWCLASIVLIIKIIVAKVSQGGQQQVDLQEPIAVQEDAVDSLQSDNEATLEPELLQIPTKLESKTEVKSETTGKPPTTLKAGLRNTRRGLFGALKAYFTGTELISSEQLEELELSLISADIGVATTNEILLELKSIVKQKGSVTTEELYQTIKSILIKSFSSVKGGIQITEDTPKPFVIMVVGINGVGKTTSIAKLSNSFKQQGHSVMIAAADTFRAAAVEQIKIWGERLDIPVVSGAENAKPAAVVFDAMVAANEQGVAVLIIDTAGRLHTKTNLMQELEGIKNIMRRHNADAPHEVLLVIDGTTGQNGLIQAREFNQAAGLTGVVVTKLDGTAKGGIVVAIDKELKVPIKYVGVGEGIADLLPFDAEIFVDALLSKEEQVVELSEHGEVRRRRARG